MFNVRPDAFWPWLYVKPPSDNPSGFRVAADGSVRDAGVDDIGFVLRGYCFAFSGAAPAEIEFEEAYRPNSDGNPFSFLDRRGPGIGPAPSFDGGSAPPHANSLLFRQMGKPRPSLRDYGGGLDAPSHTPLPGFHVKPSADDPPGFRVVADGSVRDAPINDVGSTSHGYRSGVSGAASADVGFAERIAPRAMAIHSGSSTAEVQTSAMPSFGGGSLPQHATSFLFPKMTEAQFLWPGCRATAANSMSNLTPQRPDLMLSRQRMIRRAFASLLTDRYGTTLRSSVQAMPSAPHRLPALASLSRIALLGNNPFNFLDQQTNDAAALLRRALIMDDVVRPSDPLNYGAS